MGKTTPQPLHPLELIFNCFFNPVSRVFGKSGNAGSAGATSAAMPRPRVAPLPLCSPSKPLTPFLPAPFIVPWRADMEAGTESWEANKQLWVPEPGGRPARPLRPPNPVPSLPHGGGQLERRREELGQGVGSKKKN